MFKKAENRQSELNNIGNAIANDVNGEYFGNVKSKKSIETKITRKNKSGSLSYNLYSPKDHARGTIKINNWSDAPKVIKELESKGFQVEVTIDKPLNKFGYRGINTSIRFEDQIGGEIQIHTPKTWEMKKNTSDELYRKWRDYDQDQLISFGKYNEWLKDTVKSRKMWDNYWESIPSDIKAAISSSVNGTESLASPTVTPLAGTQSPSL